MTRSIAGCSRFFTLTQCGERPARKAGLCASIPSPPDPSGRRGGAYLALFEVSQEDAVDAPVRRNKLRFPLLHGMLLGRS
jgi:hypothetical protein